MTKDLDGLLSGVDEPHVSDALARLDRHLLHSVDAQRAGRRDLADPVGHDGDERLVHVLAIDELARAPATQIGHENVGLGAEVKLWLDKAVPPTGTADTDLKSRKEKGAEPRIAAEMRTPRTGIRWSSPSRTSAVRGSGAFSTSS